MSTCKECRFFLPRYHQLGRCDRQTNPNSKIFTDDNRSNILVHISFGCVQFEAIQDSQDDII